SCRAGFVRELARPEREALLAWVERGGLLIVIGLDGYLPPEAGLTGGLPATCEDEQERGFLDSTLRGQSDAESSEVRVPFYTDARPSGPPLTHVLPFVVTRAATVDSHLGVEATVL